MNVWIIAKRELAERKLLWLLAAFVSVVGVLIPWLKHLPLDEWGIGSAGAQLGYVGAVAILLGAGTLSGDLASRRLGFFLDLPARPGAILAGRFLGVWILAVGGGLVVLVPQMLLFPAHAYQWAVLDAFAGLLAVPVILGFHILGTAWVSRSPWMLAIFGIAATSQYLLVAFESRLVRGGAFEVMVPYMIGAALLTTLALAFCAWFALAKGRLDAKRTCRLLALSLGGTCAAIVALAGLFTLWALGGGPGSLRTFRVAGAAPAGGWILVAGEGRCGRHLSLVMDLGSSRWASASVEGCFSQDGTRYLWLRKGPGFAHLVSTDLASGKNRTILEVPMEREAWETSLTVSPDGGRAVFRAGASLFLADLSTGSVLMKERRPSGTYDRFVFLPGGGLRHYLASQGGKVCVIQELDPGTLRWTRTGELPAEHYLRQVDPLGTRLLVESRDGMACLDGRTGALVGSVQEGSHLWQSGQLLENGGFAIATFASGVGTLRVFGPGGEVERTATWNGQPQGRLAQEPGTGRILMELEAPSGSGDPALTRIVALDPGATTFRDWAAKGCLAMASNRDQGWRERGATLVAEPRGGLRSPGLGGTWIHALGRARKIAFPT
jgi:hypothetical protein